VTGSLRVANELNCESIAMPAISTGIFGFPKERAAGVMFSAVEKYISENPTSTLKIIKVLLYDHSSVDVFIKVWDSLWADNS